MKNFFKNNASIAFDCLKVIIAGMSAFLLLFLLTGCANWEVVDHEHVTKSKPLPDRPQRPVNAPSRPISKGVPPSAPQQEKTTERGY